MPREFLERLFSRQSTRPPEEMVVEDVHTQIRRTTLCKMETKRSLALQPTNTNLRRKVRRFNINMESKNRDVWEIWLALLLCFVAVFTPYEVAFLDPASDRYYTSARTTTDMRCFFVSRCGDGMPCACAVHLRVYLSVGVGVGGGRERGGWATCCRRAFVCAVY